MDPKTTIKYKFVVHTNNYSGNFERDMCAFITGQVGECGVGQESVQEDVDYEGILDGLVVSEPDEHGTWRPCVIWPTPGLMNNGLGFEYRKGEEQVALEEYRKAAKKNQSDVPEPTLEELKNGYPAYFSVAIHLDAKPTEEQLAFMKERAMMYPNHQKVKRKLHQNRDKSLVVEGCELLKMEVRTTEMYRTL